MRHWLVVGCGGHARSVLDVIERLGDAVAAWVGRPGETPPGPGLLVSDEDGPRLAAEHGWHVAFGLGSTAVRERLLPRYLGLPAELTAPLVAATATVSTTARLGACAQVLEHAHVGPGALISAGTIVNTAADVEHDVVVGCCCHVAPGSFLLGGTRVGDRTFVGSGARVLPTLEVTDDVVLGAGAVVTRHVTVPGTYVGQPARPLPREEQA